jgi:(R,R)-butanediol dehydrogenase/meso-butanediol dehydrogenase/diacetyl reductase
VLISETSPQRRAAISRLGADEVIDPRTTDFRDSVSRLSDRAGAAVIFDAAGVGAAITTSIPALGPRGKLVVVGVHEKPFDFNPTSLLLQEIDMIGSIVYDDADFDAVIDNMTQGRYETAGWVEHAPLSGLLEAFEELRAGRKMKILIDL